MGKRIDIAALSSVIGTLHPPPFDGTRAQAPRRCRGSHAVRWLRLPPGAWPSQRRWHAKEDELVFVLSGEVVLFTDAGEEVLRAGDCAGFKANDPDGHCLQNRSTADTTVLEIGSRIPGEYDGATTMACLHPHGSPHLCAIAHVRPRGHSSMIEVRCFADRFGRLCQRLPANPRLGSATPAIGRRLA
jgi:hypothetical protein